MKFYTGNQFPAEYRNNIFIAEHGSWNRHTYQGGRIKRVKVDPDGKNAKQEVFAEGWITGEQDYFGRPNDILQASDGSLLVRTTGPARSTESATRSNTSRRPWPPRPHRHGRHRHDGWGAALLLAGFLALSPQVGHAAPGDPEAGRQKAELCAACHGEKGISAMPGVPSLAGQTDQFIQWQLVFFRSGRRENPLMAR